MIVAVGLISCRGSKYGRYADEEVTIIKVSPGKQIDLIAFTSLEDVHNSNELASSRGFFDSYGSTAAGMAITGVKVLIKKEQEKYHDEYSFDITPPGHHIQNDSSYFYKGISDIPFNPSDMQFNGFTIVRMCGRDTAMKAVFETDKSNLTEIFYDGVFHLKLKEFRFDYAKAKVWAKKEPRLNLDFDITFYSSFISTDGHLNNNIEIGKFSLNLAGVCLHNADSCRKFEGKRLEGFSFLVPRSYGYSVQAAKPIYSQGAFSIHVNVKETANRKLVGKLMNTYGDKIFESMDKKKEKE